MTSQESTVKHVVFVDDDEKVLEGLKRGLRSKRTEWNMLFFLTPHEAISHLEKQPADVVISDMLMPVMNGAELLEIVQKRWPDTLRMILSGELSGELVPRAHIVAHHVLSKPCGAKELAKEICIAIDLARDRQGQPSSNSHLRS